MSRQTNISDFFPGPSQRPRSNAQPDSQDNMVLSNTTSTWRGARGGFGRGHGRDRGRGRGRGQGQGRGGQPPNTTRRNRDLAEVAKETRTVLPDILPHLPNVNASASEALHLATLPALKVSDCPQQPRTTIQVVNADTFNAALDLAEANPNEGRVAVLNLASDYRAGGGWLKGARAQEEALCYRSSLYLSLHRRYYPFDHPFMGIYSPDVVIIREDMASGHDLLVPDTGFGDLPVVSVLSIAALRNPTTKRNRVATLAGTEERLEFADTRDRDLTKGKMRLCLRMAGAKHHGLLVLGALGCGAFHNPPGEVARCWREVLGENEFAGGWWKGIVFAVLDTKNEGNFEVFEEILGGMMV